MKNDIENRESETEQPDPMDIAMFYTRGDEEKSQSMVSGDYKDLYVIKIVFPTSLANGACLIFFDYVNTKFIDIFGIISQSYDIEELDVKSDWKEFENGISIVLDKDNHDSNMVLYMYEKIRENFDVFFSNNLNKLLDMSDDENTNLKKADAISSLFRRKVLNNIGLDITGLKIDYENISSLDMELNSKSSIKLSLEQIKGRNKDKDEPDEEEIIPIDDTEDEKRTLEAKDAKLIFDGNIILAPIKGMHISGLVVDDQIKVILNSGDPIAPQIARAFNAYKDGRMLPIIGKIVSFRHRPAGGYKIFVEIADGIFVRIEEDEENIKIQFHSPAPGRSVDDQENISKYVDNHIKIEQKKRSKQEKTTRPYKKESNELNLPVVIALIIFAVFIIAIIVIVIM